MQQHSRWKKNPRTAKRFWNIEIPELQRRFAPTFFQTGDAGDILIVSTPSLVHPGKALVATMVLHGDWPVSNRNSDIDITVSGYTISPTFTPSPQDKLADIFSDLFNDMRDAEAFFKASNGQWFEKGVRFSIENPSAAVNCSICTSPSTTKCICCNQVFCSEECQIKTH